MHGLTLSLSIDPSPWLRLALLGVHLLAGVAVLLADLAVWGQVLLLLTIAVSLLLHLRRQATHEIRCEPDGSLQIRIASEWRAATLLPASVVMPWLVVLHYRVEDNGQTHHLVMPPDSLPSDDFRRLRVWLKWKAKTEVNAALHNCLANMANRLSHGLGQRGKRPGN
jgi:toxin CptA